MIIAVDGMGGDNSPNCIVEGVIKAIENKDLKIILVGKETLLFEELNKYVYDKDKIRY